MGRTLLVCMAVAAFVGACGNQKPMTLPASDPIPVHAWWSIPSDSTSVERYRELADAGFTSSMTPFPNADAVQKALDAADGTGVKLFITCPEMKTDPDGTVKRFMNHPSLAGYHIVDEPNARLFPELGEWVKRIQAADATHPCYINLFPTYANEQQLGVATYQAYVDSFVATVPVPFISFDHYPVTNTGMRSDWYGNLEIISSAARKAGKPFWAFALSTALDPVYIVPTPAHLRLQVYSDLAYGASVIQYFTYWTPVSPSEGKFHDAPIEVNGARTPTYEFVRAMNLELQALAGVFVGSKVVSIGHTGTELPRGTKAFEPFPPFKAVETPAGGAVVSRLEKDGAAFLVVVNRDYTNYLNLNIT
ncbi:MAG: beta-galactosidase, partial [Candidatus Latescibacterota bacterium]